MVLATHTNKICVISPVNFSGFTLMPGYYLAQRTVYSQDDQFDRTSSAVITRCDDSRFVCDVPLDEYDRGCEQGSILIEIYSV